MAEDKKLALDIEVKGVEQSIESVKDLKKAIKEAKDEQIKAAQVYGESSKEFIAASKNVSNLKDKVEDLNDSTKSLKGSGVERASEGFNQLGEGLRNLDFDKVKVGLIAMKSALAAVGIGLIVQAVMYLVENFDELSKGSGILAKVLQGVGAIITSVKDAINSFTDSLGLTNTALDELGDSIKTNADKAKEALAGQTAEYDRQIAIAKASGKSAVDLEIAKQQAIIDTNKSLVEQTIAYVRQGGVLNDEQKKLLTSQLEAIKGAVNQQEVITLTAERTKNEKLKTEDLKRSEDLKKINADRLAEYTKSQEDELAALKKRNADEFTEKENARLKEMSAEDAAKQDKLNKQLLDAELKVAQDATSLEAKLALNEAQRNIALSDETLTAEGINLIRQEFANKDVAITEEAEAKKKQLQQDTANAYLDIATASNDSMQSLSDAFFAIKTANLKKGSKEELKAAENQFKINKALAISSAVISGIQGVMNALSAQSVLPEPIATVLRVATAVGVGVAAVANVAKIASQKFNPGGGGGGSAAATLPSAPPIPAPPTINTPENNANKGTTFDETGKNLNESQKIIAPTINVNATIGVDEVTKTQGRVDVLENQATFK